MNCSACGTQLRNDADKCRACGHPVSRPNVHGGLSGASKVFISAGRQRNRQQGGETPDESAVEEKQPVWNRKFVFLLSIAGILIMVAANVVGEIEDNPIKQFYLVIVVMATVVIPIVQVISQRRAMAGQYMRNLDILHDLLELQIGILIDPKEKIVDEAIAVSGRGQELLILTPRRLVWITTQQAGGVLEPVTAYSLLLGNIKSVVYKKLTGKFILRLDTGEKQTFGLPPSSEAEGFAAQVDFRMRHAAALRAEKDNEPVTALCLKCGRYTARGGNLCDKHVG